MRAVLQRVTRGSVSVEGEPFASIQRGLVILLAIGADDHADDAQLLATKIVELRIFDDERGKMNRSLRDVGGAALVVPQFTLYGDARHGRRPDFTAAAAPEQGRRLFDAFVGFLRGREAEVAAGRFGAHMRVEIENDGPVTIVLTTDGWREAQLGDREARSAPSA